MGTTDPRSGLARRGREREALLKTELERIVRELREMGAQRVILFGSRARGSSGVWSDADLMVVMPSTEAFVERIVSIYRRLRPQAEIDILVYTPEEFAVGNPVIRQAAKEGKVLYDASA